MYRVYILPKKSSSIEIISDDVYMNFEYYNYYFHIPRQTQLEERMFSTIVILFDFKDFDFKN